MKQKDHQNHIPQDCLVTLSILAFASLICMILQRFSSTDTHVPLLFVLAVLCVSRFTHGYIYGIIASVLAVIGVNYAFTYPYFVLDFSLTGYPLTFVAMLSVSIFVSALTSQIKQQEKVRLEMESEKMRANLLRSISHDIRTPLTSIVGSASAILENDEQLEHEQRLELVSDIRREAEWLNRVVENILSITRINTNNAEITTTPELAEEIVSSAVNKYSRHFPDTPVEVMAPAEVLMVPMDATLVEQVLVNLLENAVLHGETTTKITLRVLKCTGEAVFIVEDDGRGISPDILPHLFDGTLPIGEMDAGQWRSMRIGLSICQSIITAHHGRIWAENREEGGARFCFALPVQDEE